jgi:CheY-like chemotaxis protein
MDSSPALIEPDVSARKRGAAALRAQRLQLKQVQKLEAIGQLAGDVVHNFNNMLTAIIGYTDLSLRQVSPEDPVRGNLEQTRKAAERAASLVRQVRTVFREYLPGLDDEDMTNEELPQDIIDPRELETILLVEDEEVVRGLIKRILVQAGYTVLDAGGGMEAIRLCCAHPGTIDLLLTDVVLPEISGQEVAQCIMDLRPTIRILYMSGYTDETLIQNVVRDEKVEFIQKPFSWVGLTRKVRQVLDRNRI